MSGKTFYSEDGGGCVMMLLPNKSVTKEQTCGEKLEMRKWENAADAHDEYTDEIFVCFYSECTDLSWSVRNNSPGQQPAAFLAELC